MERVVRLRDARRAALVLYSCEISKGLKNRLQAEIRKMNHELYDLTEDPIYR